MADKRADEAGAHHYRDYRLFCVGQWGHEAAQREA